jgi:hypothetical protein
MTNTKTIEIIVSPTGQTTVETRGFTGATCQEASRFLEQALGNRTGERLTAEFYQTQVSEPLRQEGSQ